MDTKVIVDTEKCKGCLLCTTVCPAQIIEKSKDLNSKGYYPVLVQTQAMQECKQCAFCVLVCPDAALKVKVKGA